jgi:hypothetical protein
VFEHASKILCELLLIFLRDSEFTRVIAIPVRDRGWMFNRLLCGSIIAGGLLVAIER